MAERPQVVIIGAGFGGLAAAKRLEAEPVDVVLIDQRNYHTFLPLLYQVATAGLNAADVAYATRGLFRRQQRVFFRRGRVMGVDWDQRCVQIDDEPPVAFDYLIVAAGASANFFGVPGAAEYSYPLYTLPDALRLRNHIIDMFEEADADASIVEEGALTFVVVGGGPTGVEVAGALAELIDKVFREDFHDLDVHRSRIVLVEQAPHLLGPFDRRSRDYAHKVLAARGVEVRLGTVVEADRVRFSDGGSIATRTLVWAAGVKAGELASTLGVTQGRGGRIAVGSDLSIPGHPTAFAVGDIADMDDGKGGRHPQLAQVAMQGGRHAAEQVLATMGKRPREPFSYFDKGTMATIGRRAAVAELPGGAKLTGALAWLAWLVLHLLYLMGVRNKVSVFVNWAWNYFTWDRGPRLILRAEDGRRGHEPAGPGRSVDGDR
jgi:NADH dehydrogenase